MMTHLIQMSRSDDRKRPWSLTLQCIMSTAPFFSFEFSSQCWHVSLARPGHLLFQPGPCTNEVNQVDRSGHRVTNLELILRVQVCVYRKRPTCLNCSVSRHEVTSWRQVDADARVKLPTLSHTFRLIRQTVSLVLHILDKAVFAL